MIYAIDFDGTIVENKYPEIGDPNNRLIGYLKHLKNKGNTLILWTCRVGKELQDAVNYCKSLGLTFDYINENTKEHIAEYGGDTRKVFADYYIDDKAMPFEYFDKAKPKVRLGDLTCKDIDCVDCPLRAIHCRGFSNNNLYEKLEKSIALVDSELYAFLKSRLDKEIE